MFGIESWRLLRHHTTQSVLIYVFFRSSFFFCFPLFFRHQNKTEKVFPLTSFQCFFYSFFVHRYLRLCVISLTFIQQYNEVYLHFTHTWQMEKIALLSSAISTRLRALHDIKFPGEKKNSENLRNGMENEIERKRIRFFFWDGSKRENSVVFSSFSSMVM